MKETARICVLRSLVASSTADDVWGLIGVFGRPQTWLPGIIETEIVSQPGFPMQRRCASVHGDFHETLVEAGPNWHLYTIDSGPLPVRDYRSLLGVAALTPTCCGVLWLSSFMADQIAAPQAERLIERILDAGTSRLQILFKAERDIDHRYLQWGLPVAKVAVQ